MTEYTYGLHPFQTFPIGDIMKPSKQPRFKNSTLPTGPFSLFILLLCFVFSNPGHSAALPGSLSSENAVSIYDDALFSANRLRIRVTNNGHIASHQVTGSSGAGWPDSWDISLAFSQGFCIAGFDAQGQLHGAFTEFTTEFMPGKILPDGNPEDPAHEKNRIYSIGRGFGPEDYLAWPVEDGAPLDSRSQPWLPGSQTHWWTCNDAAPHTNLFYLPQIGVEAQVTLFGYDSIPGLQDAAFIRVLFIHKGSEDLDSVFVGWWDDVDLGSANNDLCAVDSSRQMMLVYNGYDLDSKFLDRSPAYGLYWLQGPLVPSPGDSGRLGNRIIPDHRNLPMTSGFRYISSSPAWGDPETGYEFYDHLSGHWNGALVTDPVTGRPTRFFPGGDPLTGEGSLDSSPSDRRMVTGSGPFHFAVGDTQEIIWALAAGEGRNALGGIRSLRAMRPLLQDLHSNNFQVDNIPLKVLHSPPEHQDNPEMLRFELKVKDVLKSPFAGPASGVTGDLLYSLDSSTALTLSAELIPVGRDASGWYSYAAEIPNPDQETEIRYCFRYDNGQGMVHYPLAGPELCYSVIAGPDETPPFLIQFDPDYIVSLPYSWLAQREIFTDPLRPDIDPPYHSIFPRGSADLHWELIAVDRYAPGIVGVERQLNSGPWTAVQDTVEAVWTDTVYYGLPHLNWRSFSIDLQAGWDDLEIGDTLRWRLILEDRSAAKNRVISEERELIRTRIMVLSDFETSSFRNTRNWESRGWYQIMGGMPFGFGMSADSVIGAYRTGLDNTLTYRYSLPSSDLEHLTLQIHHSYGLEEWDWMILEVSLDKRNWVRVWALADTTKKAWHWKSTNFDELNESGEYWIRLRFTSNLVNNLATQNYGWYIARIQLVADSVIVGIDTESLLPTEFSLLPNYPNPFNPLTHIPFTLPETADVTLNIFDIRGRLLWQRSAASLPAGTHEFLWTGIDEEGRSAPSGVYLVRLEKHSPDAVSARPRSLSRKILLLK